MISCVDFRTRFEAATEDPHLLGHLRTCDVCLDHAAHVDPDAMFRALGGEMTPPGGVDAFVADVMHSVQLRSKEGALAPVVRVPWPRRLAYAAALAAGITGAALVYQGERSTVAPVSPGITRRPPTISMMDTTKPVVETYSSQNATILEVPSEGASDTKIVMVFDEGLPADL